MKKIGSLLIVLSLIVMACPFNALGSNVTEPNGSSGYYSLPSGRSGVDYEYRFRAEGGLAPLKWRLAGGQLPEGIELTESGILRGKPTVARREAFTFSLEVSDSSEPPQTFVQQFALSVQAAPLKMVLGASTLKIIAPEPDRRVGPYMEAVKQGSNSGGTGKTVATHSTKTAAPSDSSVNGNKDESDEPETDTTVDEQIPPPNIWTKLVAGLMTIEGIAKPKAKVTMFLNGEELQSLNAGVEGNFKIELSSALIKGQKVSFQQSVNGVAGIMSDEMEVAEVSDLSGWGRVRAYFSGGVVFSKERDDFSQQDIFLGLNVDKNWIKGKRFNFNSYIDVRLTSVPVNVKATEMGEISGGEEGGGEGDGGEGNGEGGDDQGDNGNTEVIDTFITSKKAALMQIGFYAPISLGYPKSETNSLFVAPIFKAGIQTITSDFNSAEGVNFGRDDVFNFGAAGFRIGHMKLAASNNDESHEIMSYLDIMRGKWENFEILLPVIDPLTGKQKEIQDPDDPMKTIKLDFRERRWRWAFEGRLKVPLMPLYVGFDANLGDGADDVRFLFGTKFDVGKLFSKLGLPK